MKRHFESGASKRQKKKMKESAVKILTPITSFFLNETTTEKPETLFEKEISSSCNVTVSDHRNSVNETEVQNTDEIELEEGKDLLNEDGNTARVETELQDLFNDNETHLQHADIYQNNEKVIPETELNIGTLIVSDIGILDKNNPSQLNSFLKVKRFEIPQNIGKDALNRAFPYSLLSKKLPNGEICNRDWLCWSIKNQSIYCAPCYILNKKTLPFSYLTDITGYTIQNGWKKLYERIPSHENSLTHKENYVLWKNSHKRALAERGIENLLLNEIADQTNYWKKLLERYLDIIFFISERGLPFFGSDARIGSPQNGNFLGLVELLSKYDPILAEHVSKVRAAQEDKKRMQVHYLSTRIQNEFINICGSFVQNAIIEEVKKAKYFAIIADSTPDSSHQEQTTLIIRYVKLSEMKFSIEERFICFDNFSDRTGQEIASRLLNLLQELKLNFKNCVGQGYDNGANMAGKYNGVQAVLLRENSNCTFSGCGNHTLNLVGVDSAESCKEAITFFGTVQLIYNFFSGSPKRWEVLKKHLPRYSLHDISKTRWSARLEAVKPVALNLKSLQSALNEINLKRLPVDAQTQIPAFKKYLSKFECVLMSTVWLKILVLLHQTNLIIESRKATLDVEKYNIENLIKDIEQLKKTWKSVLDECKKIATENKITSEFEINRRLKDQKSAEEYFHLNVYNKIINSVIDGLTRRFQPISLICSFFEVLWKFNEMSPDNIVSKAKLLLEKYKNEISDEIIEELILLKRVYKSNFKLSTKPAELLKEIIEMGFVNIFPNIAIVLRIFLTMPVSVAEGERSFSVLKRIKNYLRSTMCQERLNGLATLNINYQIARILDYSEIISEFANVKARKASVK